MDLLSFDIEIFDELSENPDKNEELKHIRPSVAALTTDGIDIEYFYDIPFMTVDTAKNLVHRMIEYYEKGFRVYGWNIVSFDLRLMAYYSGMMEECGILALQSIDPMMQLTFNKGYYLGLDTALIGAGLETKTHSVVLNDGSTLESMSGKLAPSLWNAGEYEAVKFYLKGDVVQPLKLADAILRNHGIKWFSKTQKPMSLYLYQLEPSYKLFSIPRPNNSWMDNPPQRKDFVSWIPKNILDQYGIFLEYCG